MIREAAGGVVALAGSKILRQALRGLRAMGPEGVQLPVWPCRDGKLVGTERFDTDARFDTEDGGVGFLPAPWGGVPWPAKVRVDQGRVGGQESSV